MDLFLVLYTVMLFSLKQLLTSFGDKTCLTTHSLNRSKLPQHFPRLNMGYYHLHSLQYHSPL